MAGIRSGAQDTMPVRLVFLGAIVFGLLVGGSIAAFRAFPTEDAPSLPEASPTPDPADPADVAAALATALSESDASALHALLDDGDAATVPATLIEGIFENLAEESALREITGTVESASEAGATISITLSTGYFGDVQYAIDAAFTAGPAGELRVRWSPSLIHPRLESGLAFEATLERPTRGAILDRNGVVLAETADNRFLGLNRSIISSPAAVEAKLLAFGFPQDAIDAAFASSLGSSQRVPVGIVPDERQVEANELVLSTTGLLLWFEPQRTHPLGPAAAHAVGYTRELTADELASRAGLGYVIGDRIGATGLEAGADTYLAGQPGGILRIVDPGHTLDIVVAEREYRPGGDLHTTLDAAVLQRSYERLGERAGASVVINPSTNEVLAINSSPSYDPAAFENNNPAAISAILANDGNPLNNRATNGVYSAGSTFKLITGAAGFESGFYTPTSLINCPSIWDGVDPPRRNWEGGQGLLTVAQGLMRSCNTLFYEIGLTIYNETDNLLSQVARKFGFGAPTGIVGIPEQDGLVPDAEWKVANRGEPWYPGDEVNLAIGQGDLLITPLQLANAYSAFVNNALRTPVIIQGQDPGPGTPLGLTPEQHAHLLLGLKLVTGASGTASAAFSFAGYTDFAGKSGTAEDAGAQQHVLFVAFSPAAAPTALAAVVLDDGESGSIEAGPIARDMVLAALAP